MGKQGVLQPDVFPFKSLAYATRPVELLKKMDVPGCVGVFRYFAGSAHHILGESTLSSPRFLNVTVRQPYGVAGLIIPWNLRSELRVERFMSWLSEADHTISRCP